MKIVKDDQSLLVLKESALTGYIVGAVLFLVGIGMIIGGTRAHKNQVALYAIGAVVAVISLILFIIQKSDTVTVDKSARKVDVNFKSLIKKSGQNMSFSFDDVASVQMTQTMRQVAEPGPNSGNNVNIGGAGVREQIQYTLVIMLKNGTAVTVASESHQANFNLGVSSSSLPSKGQKLASAIGVQFQDSGVASANQVIHSVEQTMSEPSVAKTESQPVAPLQPQVQPPVQPQTSSPQPTVISPQTTPLPQDQSQNSDNIQSPQNPV